MFNELIFIAGVLFVVVITSLATVFGANYLLALFLLQGFLANIFLLKEISILGLSVCAADIFIVGILLALNFLEEFYGKKEADSAVKVYIFAMLSFFIFSVIHLLYMPAPLDKTHFYFEQILGYSPRIIFATLLVSSCSLSLDRMVYRFLSTYLGRSYLPIKNLFAAIFSQFFDTIFFSLFVIDLFANIWTVAFFSYFVKLMTMFLLTPLLFGFMRWFMPRFNLNYVKV